MCLSLRCSTSAIKFTMNNTYIHLISLISASSGKQKMHFHPYGASKSSDLSHGQAPVGRRNHCFRRPASPHEIRIRLKLTAVRSLHKVCLKNTCFHRWKKKKKKAGIFMRFSVASLDMGTCIPIISESSAPCHQGTLHYLWITKQGERKTMLLLLGLGRVTT